MKRSVTLLCLVIFCMVHMNALTQVVVNKAESYISWLNKGTVYEMGAAKINTGDIVLFYHAQGEEKFDFGEIVFADQSDFNSFYDIIISGFSGSTDRPLKVDLGEDFVYLHYTPMLFGTPNVYLEHGYKASPYVTKTSRQLSQKDIKKLFGKIET